MLDRTVVRLCRIVRVQKLNSIHGTIVAGSRLYAIGFRMTILDGFAALLPDELAPEQCHQQDRHEADDAKAALSGCGLR